MMNKKIMKRDVRRQAARAVAAAVLVEGIAAVAGCSLIVGGLEMPNETAPAGGNAGMGGFAGSAGHAGNGGEGAQAGTGGEAGQAGGAGFGGFGGEAGTGGVGGTAGNGGAGGSGTVCPGVFNETVTSEAFYVSTPKTVGGYDIINMGQGGNGITVDIECAANQTVIDQGVYCNEGGPESHVNITADGKRIRLTNLSDGATVANMSVAVENL